VLFAAAAVLSAVDVAAAADCPGVVFGCEAVAASAAAADELAAIAAAAIASGAVELPAAGGVGATFAGVVGTGIAVAIAFCAVAAAPACDGVAESVDPAALPAEFLSADLSSPGFVPPDFVLPGGAALPLPAVFAAELEPLSVDCPPPGVEESV
jgi:hypothetical protein